MAPPNPSRRKTLPVRTEQNGGAVKRELSSLDGVTSPSVLTLLQDLRDVSQFIFDRFRHQPQELITAPFVRAVNAQITRSGAIHPGRFRTSDQQIGIGTRRGRHTPGAMTDASLQRLLEETLSTTDAREAALDLLVKHLLRQHGLTPQSLHTPHGDSRIGLQARTTRA